MTGRWPAWPPALLLGPSPAPKRCAYHLPPPVLPPRRLPPFCSRRGDWLRWSSAHRHDVSRSAILPMPLWPKQAARRRGVTDAVYKEWAVAAEPGTRSERRALAGPLPPWLRGRNTLTHQRSMTAGWPTINCTAPCATAVAMTVVCRWVSPANLPLAKSSLASHPTVRPIPSPLPLSRLKASSLRLV